MSSTTNSRTNAKTTNPARIPNSLIWRWTCARTLLNALKAPFWIGKSTLVCRLPTAIQTVTSIYIHIDASPMSNALTTCGWIEGPINVKSLKYAKGSTWIGMSINARIGMYAIREQNSIRLQMFVRMLPSAPANSITRKLINVRILWIASWVSSIELLINAKNMSTVERSS